MTDAVTISLIAAAGSAITAVITTIGLIFIQKMKATIITLEKNTNSMKDALVAVTGKEAFERGLKEGKEIGEHPSEKGWFRRKP